MSDHAYVSSKHCNDCNATYMRRWRGRTGGKKGARERAARRSRIRQFAEDNPERFRTARGLVADLETGVVYGKRWDPIGSHNRDGYLAIDRRCTDDGRSVMAHRVVWEAAHGPLDDDTEVNHLNGVKDDNRLDNLEAVTREENLQHAYRTGLASNEGERHPNSKLTAADVRHIRAEARRGLSARAIARDFDVSRRQVSDVINGTAWSHIEGES